MDCAGICGSRLPARSTALPVLRTGLLHMQHPLASPLNLYALITITPNLYNTNSVCVCVCLSSIGGQTAGPIITKFGTYMQIDLGMVPTKKNGPTYGPEGWTHWGHSSKRVLSWRHPSSDSEPLAKQREEL